MRDTTSILCATFVLTLSGGCKREHGAAADGLGNQSPAVTPTTRPAAPAVKTADAPLKTAAGRDVGDLSLRQEGGKVTLNLKVKGLPPGPHGFHIHEKGECTPPGFKSAGGHFNPTGVKHGGPTDEIHHAGDFGNVTVGKDGTGELTITSNQITLGEGKTSIIGKAVIIHAHADDLKSQPSGAAGPRIACGVIKANMSP
jgi:Cu-Zn family superoxide dismutase